MPQRLAPCAQFTTLYFLPLALLPRSHPTLQLSPHKLIHPLCFRFLILSYFHLTYLPLRYRPSLVVFTLNISSFGILAHEYC
ncbi:hypothetical protein K438DRAFT_1840085, partial [Mycena galopus ATCC 62051]